MKDKQQRAVNWSNTPIVATYGKVGAWSVD